MAAVMEYHRLMVGKRCPCCLQPEPIGNSGEFTMQEQHILACIAAGHTSDRAMMAELNMSRMRLKWVLFELYRKLGARNREHAAALAMQRGLIR